MDPKQFGWYFDVLGQSEEQSAGCGIGFDRVVQSIMATVVKAAVELPRSPEYLMP